ncbi:elongation factor P [Oenococcus alcoholitolerans]|uniref:elongation factor P n=1 Tax=Oenococcus alcoholitolerans TaxID=931074 RepID=UPI003F709FD1
MAIDTSSFKNGLTIEYNNAIWRIIEFQHVKPGKGGAFVRSKLKNLRTGAVNEVTFRAGERMELAEITTRPMQYLYQNGDNYVFMDTETYDQVEIPGNKIQDALKFMLENMNVKVTSYKDEILEVELPATVELTVQDTQPSIKGATVNGGGKPATLETGLVVTVPDFINVGDKLVINTADGGSYKERA